MMKLTARAKSVIKVSSPNGGLADLSVPKGVDIISALNRFLPLAGIDIKIEANKADEWISVKDRLPEKTEDNDGKCYYTFSYGEVRGDEWFSSYPRGSDGWGNKCDGGAFYQPNSDSDYSGEFKADGVTHWMEMPPKELPEPPITP